MTNKLSFRLNKKTRYACWMAGLLAAFVAQSVHAETPAEFASRFSNFEFVFHEKIQDPQVFLSTRSGDCDDFATLAAVELKKGGHTPRLFAVRMKGETHVICYVPEANAYLDYNNRAAPNPLVPTDGSLQDIARKVSDSFGRNWIAAYEFSYAEKTKWLVNTIVMNKTEERGILATVF